MVGGEGRFHFAHACACVRVHKIEQYVCARVTPLNPWAAMQCNALNCTSNRIKSLGYERRIWFPICNILMLYQCKLHAFFDTQALPMMQPTIITHSIKFSHHRIVGLVFIYHPRRTCARASCINITHCIFISMRLLALRRTTMCMAHACDRLAESHASGLCAPR